MATKWDNNLIQFARLICEINATQELNMPELAKSMDLTDSEVGELFDRTNTEWESAKEETLTERVKQ